MKPKISNNIGQSREQTESTSEENIHFFFSVRRWNLHMCLFSFGCVSSTHNSLSRFIDRRCFAAVAAFCLCRFCYERAAKRKSMITSMCTEKLRNVEKMSVWKNAVSRNSNCFIIELDRLIAQIVCGLARILFASQKNQWLIYYHESCWSWQLVSTCVDNF